MGASPTELESVLQGDVHEWLEGLPPYQRSLVEEMVQRSDDLPDVAISWLAASGPRDTAPFGGVRGGATLFYDNLLTEIQQLFCGEDRYKSEREELKSAAAWTKMGIVSFVAFAIGPHIGVSAVVIAPAVAIVLAVLSRAGRNTVCGRIAALIADRSAGDQN